MTAPLDLADHLRISICEMRLEMHVGVNDWEKNAHKPQLLTLDLDAYVPAPVRLRPETRGDVVDYERIRNDILAWSKRPHEPFLETLVEEIADIVFRDEKVMAVRVRLQKLNIFNESRAAAVELVRRRTG